MPTKTSDIPDDPKPRVATAAKRAGNATDAFAVEVIADKSGRVTQGASLVSEADDRYARILASGETIPWRELRRYLIAHIAGVALPLPAPRRPER